MADDRTVPDLPRLLRSRTVRREEPLGPTPETMAASAGERADPEQDVLLAEEIGLALIVVLDCLTPAERIAFVLHDVFAVSFAEIGAVVGRSPVAARKLASRARTRVRGAAVPDADMARRWWVADTFLQAVRGGDLAALLAVLDRDVVRRADSQVVPTGAPTVLRGAEAVAEGTLRYSRTARHLARVALVDGSPGLVVAPAGRPRIDLRLTIAKDKITEIDVIADPGRLRRVDIARGNPPATRSNRCLNVSGAFLRVRSMADHDSKSVQPQSSAWTTARRRGGRAAGREWCSQSVSGRSCGCRRTDAASAPDPGDDPGDRGEPGISAEHPRDG